MENKDLAQYLKEEYGVAQLTLVEHYEDGGAYLTGSRYLKYKFEKRGDIFAIRPDSDWDFATYENSPLHIQLKEGQYDKFEVAVPEYGYGDGNTLEIWTAPKLAMLHQAPCQIVVKRFINCFFEMMDNINRAEYNFYLNKDRVPNQDDRIKFINRRYQELFPNVFIPNQNNRRDLEVVFDEAVEPIHNAWLQLLEPIAIPRGIW